MDTRNLEIDVYISRLVAKGLPVMEKANGDKNDVFLKVAAAKELYARTSTQWGAGNCVAYDFDGKNKNESDMMHFRTTIGKFEGSEIDCHAFDETKHSTDMLISEGVGHIELKDLKSGKPTETIVVNIPLFAARGGDGGVMTLTLTAKKTVESVAIEKLALKKKREEEAAATAVSKNIVKLDRYHYVNNGYSYYNIIYLGCFGCRRCCRSCRKEKT